jgi:hypothetical protein
VKGRILMVNRIAQYEEQKRDVKRAFWKVIGVALFVTTGVVTELASAVLWSDVWLAVAGILSALLLLAFLPIAMGEYPFFSSRAMRGPWRFFSPTVTGVLLLAVLGLRAAYPLSFVQVADWLSPVMTSIIVLGVPAAAFGIFLTWIRGMITRVELGLPKWLIFVEIPFSSTWAHPSPDIMRSLGGVPIAITNHGRQPLVITQIWLEWFAPLMIPRSFLRERALRESFERIYHKKIIELEKPRVLRPKEAFMWVLDWGNAKTLYALLRKELVEPFLGAQVAVMVAVTLHDEYSDRFYSSRIFRLELVLAESHSLSGSLPCDKSQNDDHELSHV